MTKPRKIEKDIRSPLEYGIDLICKKWNLRVICALANESPMRYSQIRETLDDISDTMLSTTLKELLQNDMISRKIYDEIPARVEYSLTEKGGTVIPFMNFLCHWAESYVSFEYADLPSQCKNCHRQQKF